MTTESSAQAARSNIQAGISSHRVASEPLSVQRKTTSSDLATAWWTKTDRPNHGCHRYKSSRKPVPWVLSNWVVQPAPSSFVDRLSIPDRIRASSRDQSRRTPVCRRARGRHGRTIVRAGMEEWLRRGPNKRMTPSRRVKCSQTRYSDPKPSTVHQTGASPLAHLNIDFSGHPGRWVRG